jgi:alpha-beta hydrolase superfamily lysophospholipase
VVLFIHGIGMHGKPYASIAAGFTSRDLTLVVPDLRGHGCSEGTRGELAKPNVLRADVGEVIGLINKRWPKAPVVLAGESMGGLIAADYAFRGERRLAGLALLAPAFKVHPEQPLPSPKELLTGILLTTDERLVGSTRDKGFIKARKEDRLALTKVKASYLIAIGVLQKEWPKAAADLKMPLFIGVAGKDKVVDPEVIEEVYKKPGTPKKDKTWWKWGKARHTLCWDPETPKVIEELAKWALARAKTKKKKSK